MGAVGFFVAVVDLHSTGESVEGAEFWLRVEFVVQWQLDKNHDLDYLFYISAVVGIVV